MAFEHASGKTPRPGCIRSRVLVVDDEPEIRRLNVEMLALEGYEVDAAEDGAIAWETLNSAHYDLLITDNKMPRVTGLELIEQVHIAQMKLPIIMATGTLPTEEFARKPWLTPEAVLLKPYSLAAMAAKVREILGSGRRKSRMRPAPRSNWRSLPSQFDLSS